MVGCLSSQQHGSVSLGRVCFTCCHTEIEGVDQTFYLTQSQYTDTGPTSLSADRITPGARRVATGLSIFNSLVKRTWSSSNRKSKTRRQEEGQAGEKEEEVVEVVIVVAVVVVVEVASAKCGGGGGSSSSSSSSSSSGNACCSTVRGDVQQGKEQEKKNNNLVFNVYQQFSHGKKDKTNPNLVPEHPVYTV